MIIVRIKTGLGSQLFQYATARRLAFVNNARLLLDISSFETNLSRHYSLYHFNIDADIANEREIDLFSEVERLDNPSDRLRARVEEKHYHFDPDILTLRGDIYLNGFWQSEKYFEDIQDLLRSELTIVNEPTAENRRIADLITKTNSVSLHIRRGDHVSNPFVSEHHGFLPLDYYYAAVRYIEERISCSHYYVFSDEPHWAQANLYIESPTTFINVNSVENAYEDLRLMSMCKHHIIANSGLSWWGAWLSQYSKKLVCAPRMWFAKQHLNTDDLVPSSWTRL